MLKAMVMTSFFDQGTFEGSHVFKKNARLI